ncbi:hypothetical protein [Sphaerisporangium dianthi]|uniref:Uncharacterized protein n=1 Tax=Sphaerisporangium dianthi TaxID=1436120 RepID=A0ABV9CV62_9ACTN
MIERADQLVLEYVSKVADAAHGVLRTDQRLDFVQRLRARIEEERRGSEDPAAVRKVLARFGDPSVVLQREVARLTGAEPEPARRAGGVHGARGQAASRPPFLSRLSSGPASSSGSPSPGSRASGSPSPGSSSPGSAASAQGPVPVHDAASAQGAPSGEAAAPPGGPAPAPVEEAATSVMPAVPVSGPAMTDEFGDSATEVLPAVTGDRPPRTPAPGAPGQRRRPSRAVRPLPRGAGSGARRASPRAVPRGVPPSGRFGRAAAMAAPRAADGRDASTVLTNERREVAGMALLLVSGLLLPLPLPYVAIFPIPVLVWAVGALTVLACDGWVFRDRIKGLLAPIAAYVFGGVLLGALRSPEAEGEGLAAFVNSFWHVSGLMFMLGAAGGVAWLAYRLFNPPPPPPRRQPLGVPR